MSRIKAEFSGYLVTDQPALPVFSLSCGGYESSLGYDYTTTSGSWCYPPYIRYYDEAGGAIDAPKWIAAGFMSARFSEYVGESVPRAVLRAGA